MKIGTVLKQKKVPYKHFYFGRETLKLANTSNVTIEMISVTL